jgi:hypothetical protein
MEDQEYLDEILGRKVKKYKLLQNEYISNKMQEGPRISFA